MPEDCILFSDPIMKEIFKYKDIFLTKKCRFSFGGYAVEQIKKARGLNKKMNWEENEMVRKSVLDFCYVTQGGGSILLKEWIQKEVNYTKTVEPFNGPNDPILLKQEDIGLVAIDHMKDFYAMYRVPRHSGMVWGIVSNEETANDVQLTSVPKGLSPIGTMSFNKDGYTLNCKQYLEYQTWLKNRNETRVNMAKAHGKNYDGKNLNHCLRILNVANEISEGKGIKVRRSPEEIEKLISIRKGEYEYEDILAEAEKLIADMDKKFAESNLPNNVDPDMVNDILVKIRKEKYGLK